MVEHDGLIVRLHVLKNCVDIPAKPFRLPVGSLPPGCRIYCFDRNWGAGGETKSIVRLGGGSGNITPAAQLISHQSCISQVKIPNARNAQVGAYLDLCLANVVVLQTGHVADHPDRIACYQSDEEY